MHLGSDPAVDYGHHGNGGNDARFLTKGFFRDILSAHYRQPDLKVLRYDLLFTRKNKVCRGCMNVSLLYLE